MARGAAQAAGALALLALSRLLVGRQQGGWEEGKKRERFIHC